jgi:hypothetical protein
LRIDALDSMYAYLNKIRVDPSEVIVNLEHIKVSNSYPDTLSPSVFAKAVQYSNNKGYGFQYWELTNEPYYTSNAVADPAYYGLHCRNVYQAIKEVDSEAKVGIMFLRGASWNKQLFDTLVKYNVKYDFFNGHFYAWGDTDIRTTEELIAHENIRTLELIAKLNQDVINSGNQNAVHRESEWRLYPSNSVYDGENHPYLGNIVGATHAAYRLVYLVRDGYMDAANIWCMYGANSPQSLIGKGWNNTLNRDMSGCTNVPYYIIKYFNKYIFDSIPSYNGTTIYSVGTVEKHVDEGAGGSLEVYAPLVVSLVTVNKSKDSLSVIIVNAQENVSEPVKFCIPGYEIKGYESVIVSQNSVNDTCFIENEADVVKGNIISYSDSTVLDVLPPLSTTFIKLALKKIEETPVSVVKPYLRNAISIYPNPAKKDISVSVYADSEEMYSISILDINRNQVYFNGNLKGSNLITIPTNSFAAGMYFVCKTTDSGLIEVQKLAIVE